GSTGTSKIVVLSHRNILSRSASTVAVNGMTSASRTLNWMPLDHVGGLVMFHIRDTFLGCTQIHATKQWLLAHPLRWLDLIDRHRVDTTWATNSTYDLVADRVSAGADRDWDLSCLRYLMNGGEPVRAASVLRFLDALAPFGLSGNAMRPGWGMSETSSGVVDHQLAPHRLRADDRFVPVGVPHPGVSVRVVDEREDPVPAGTIGHLQVTGAPVALGYWSAGALDRRACTADGWFRTGDMAFVADGMLTVTGSADDVIVVDGRTWHGHEIEAVIAELPFVTRRSVVAAAVADELAVFCHLPASVDRASDLVRDIVLRRCGLTVAYVVPVAEPDFPRTRTGKPMRAAVRERFAVRTMEKYS
ncbi:MAG TPA: AMP-binding protein, partial [Pseudonocardiaceae bacterium]|nr:AMP-binding protein [Pseudonocardiaceae bacterium]